MKRFVQGVLAAAFLLSLSAGPGHAAGTAIGVGLSNFTVIGYHGMGVGAFATVPFGANGWAFNVDGRFEMGNYKEEDSSGPTTDTFEERLSGFRVRGGVDHSVMVGPVTMYAGTGVSYASHKITTEFTGSPEDESEPYNVFGISSRIGGSLPFGEGNPLEMFVQLENTLGWGSFEDGDFKVNQTDSQNGAMIGLLYRMPSNR